jgi:hypothetical protein
LPEEYFFFFVTAGLRERRIRSQLPGKRLREHGLRQPHASQGRRRHFMLDRIRMIPGNFFSISHKACDLIGQLDAGKNFSDYKNDPLFRSGVERQFGIIGEALNPFRTRLF